MKKYFYYILLFSFVGVHAQWSQIGQTLSGEASGDYYGASVSSNAEGNIIAVGATLGFASQTGYVKVYSLIGSTWEQLGQEIEGLTNNDLTSEVSLNDAGNILAVGSPGYNGFIGKVTVYYFDGTLWIPMGSEIYPSDGDTPIGYFGQSVSLSSDGFTLAIGAPFEYINDIINIGSVRIFHYNGNSWQQLGQTIYGQGANDMFGNSVCLNSEGNILAAGADKGINPNLYQSGSLRIYQLIGNSWTQLGENIDGLTALDHLSEVSINNSGTIVGYSSWTYNQGSGVARIFEYNGNSWQQLGNPIVGIGNSGSGYSIDLNADGDTVAVGGSFNTSYYSTTLGRVNIYKYNGNDWIKLGCTITGTSNESFFGNYLSLNDAGNGLVVGAHGGNGSTPNSGIVKTYQFKEADPVNDAVLYKCSSGTTANFNLSEANSSIITNPLNYHQFSYHTTYQGAEMGTNIIAYPLNFPANSNTVVYAKVKDATGCVFSIAAITLIVTPIPTLSVDDLSVCSGNTITISPTTSGESINWYDSQSSVSPLFSGLSYTTPILTETTTLWVEAINYDSSEQNFACTSTRVPITITVLDKTLPLFAQISPICEGEILTALPLVSLNGISGSWSPTLNNSETTTYLFTPDDTECAETTSMEIIVHPFSIPFDTIPFLEACDTDHNGYEQFHLQLVQQTLEDMLESGYTVHFYENLTDAENMLPSIDLSQDYISSPLLTINGIQTIWVRIQNESGCYKILTLLLKIHDAPQAYPIVNNAIVALCDTDGTNDGYTNGFDLTIAENEILGSQNATDYNFGYYLTQSAATIGNENTPDYINIPTNFLNTIPIDQVIWIRIYNDYCYDITSISIHVEPVPDINILAKDNLTTICKEFESGNILQDVELQSTISSGSYNLQWYMNGIPLDGQNANYLITSQEGDYQLSATGTAPNYCYSISDIFHVTLSGPAVLAQNGIIIQNFDNESLILYVEGYGEYEYSLSPDGPWQSSNIFDQLESGVYTIYVRDAISNGNCGILEVNDILVLNYPRFFTPNQDGYNDFWTISGLKNDSGNNISIFDRYGKLLLQFDPTITNGWDGTYNGKPLPSNDYWFILNYRQGEKMLEFKSHFSLKR